MDVVKHETYPKWLGGFGSGVLRLLGWRAVSHVEKLPKCVIVCAPHNTNWDLFFFLLGTLVYRMPAGFTMKKSWFFWPLGALWRWLGGVPIDRSKRGNTVDQVAEAFQTRPVLRLGIPPEGTRSAVKHWKTGFYWIARKAGVPILLAHIDYAGKQLTLSAYVHPGEDPEADLAEIAAHYTEHYGLTPEFRK